MNSLGPVMTSMQAQNPIVSPANLLTAGQIAGIVIGVTGFAIIVAAVIVSLVFIRNRKSNLTPETLPQITSYGNINEEETNYGGIPVFSAKDRNSVDKKSDEKQMINSPIAQSKLIFYEELEIQNILGSGAYGDVRVAVFEVKW
jgi:hypothetical protein